MINVSIRCSSNGNGIPTDNARHHHRGIHRLRCRVHRLPFILFRFLILIAELVMTIYAIAAVDELLYGNCWRMGIAANWILEIHQKLIGIAAKMTMKCAGPCS